MREIVYLQAGQCGNQIAAKMSCDCGTFLSVDGWTMFKKSTKTFLWLVIIVIVIIVVQFLAVRNVNVFADGKRYLLRNVNERTNNSKMSRGNIINAVLQMPMAAMSRNILDRYSEYRQIKRVADFKQLYDPRFSVVELENNKKSKTITAGTELIVRIHLYNGYNQSLTQGGDMFNIWLRSTDKNSSVAGYVVDHMNGSYTGHVKAFWAGNVVLKVSVTNTKEGIGLYTNYVKTHGSYKFANATFVENGRSEMTQCAPKMSDWLNKTYGGFCNETSENYNISLFCGKPKNVSCRNWVKYGWDGHLYFDSHTRKILSYKDVVLKRINLKIFPSTKGDLDYPVPDTPCNVLPRALTWNSTVPSGFLYKGVHHNLICRPTVDRNIDKYRACLKNRPFISIGDSTTRQWFWRLANFLKIKASVGFTNNNAWQKFAQAQNIELGLKMEWQPHGHPFAGSPGSDRKNVKSVAHRIDKIPSNSTAIVLIHWYAHIARCCDHEDFREKVRHAKKAITRLLTRSPDVQIFFKGPHLITYNQAYKPYAFVGMFVEQVLSEEFSDILHRVTYLEQWDMSVSTENVNIHPNAQLDDISLNNLINLACLPS